MFYVPFGLLAYSYIPTYYKVVLGELFSKIINYRFFPHQVIKQRKQFCHSKFPNSVSNYPLICRQFLQTSFNNKSVRPWLGFHPDNTPEIGNPPASSTITPLTRPWKNSKITQLIYIHLLFIPSLNSSITFPCLVDGHTLIIFHKFHPEPSGWEMAPLLSIHERKSMQPVI